MMARLRTKASLMADVTGRAVEPGCGEEAVEEAWPVVHPFEPVVRSSLDVPSTICRSTFAFPTYITMSFATHATNPAALAPCHRPEAGRTVRDRSRHRDRCRACSP